MRYSHPMRRRSKTNKDQKLQLLAKVPMFSTCNKRDLAWIARLTEEIEVDEGKVLTQQGKPGVECFVVVDGKAKASIRGRRSVSLGPGSFFGEMSLLDGGPRSATVTAEGPMRLLVLDSRGFSSLMDVPTVRRKVMTVMAERLREAERGEPGH